MDAKATILHSTAVVATLDGVTTVLVAFIFVCLVFPSIVRQKSQFYFALASIVGVLVLHTLAMMFSGSDALVIAMAVFSGVLQIVALLLLVLCVGGLTARQLAGDMSRAYEVMRRGETTKETIIPLGEQARPRGRGPAEAAGTVYHVETGQTPGHPTESEQGTAGHSHEDDEDHGIPLT